ncbi:MAG: D-hexose-6-phosphate mutarotase [Pedosphaera sp.]|nr:D-hexose-6-phosphate mutarotase [Pedosphaera sp.]
MEAEPKRQLSRGIPGRIEVVAGHGGLPKVLARADGGSAEVYLQGAHVSHFQRGDEAPLLFLSRESRFEKGKAIRGGIPIIFPWFGAREGSPMHGTARIREWDFLGGSAEDGVVRLDFKLPEASESFPPYSVEYTVEVSDKLQLELAVTNRGAQPFQFESCLHTYFAVAEIGSVDIRGLEGLGYQDKTDHFAHKIDPDPLLRIDRETDRVYFNSNGTTEVIDKERGRIIRIEKTGSASTVVWNPWTDKSAKMEDFGADEFLRMVCVESGNVGQNQVTLAPGQSSVMTVQLSIG